MELKVHCDCGQRYKFDVEPVNGLMPFTVNCPACGADGTEKANNLLQETGHAGEVLPVARLAVPAAPPPPPSAPAPMTPPPATASSGLRINRAAPAHAAPAPSQAAAPVAPVAVAPRPGLGMPRRTEPAPVQPGNFWLGILGGFLGVLVGSVIYYCIFKFTGYRIGLIGIAVGFLGGLGAHLLGKGEGSKELGGITAVLVIVGIVTAQYLVALGIWHGIRDTIADGGYADSVAEAKLVVKALPTGSDDEIRNYLAKEAADEGEKPDPKSVTAADIKEFRDKLPEYQDLASGKETKEQYMAKNQIDPKEMKDIADEGENTFKGIFLLMLLRWSNIVSMVAAVGLAFKMSTNA